MQSIELHDLEYGECIALCGKDEVLMVDCGSMSHHLRADGTGIAHCYDEIARRYLPCTDRWFLLTHYHRDHLCGFLKILENYPDYFSRIFLPCMPKTAEGTSPLLEFAVFSYLFSAAQSDNFQVNTTCMRMFSIIAKQCSTDRIFTLQAGDAFAFSGVTYDVLWPKTAQYPFAQELLDAVEALNVLYASPFLTGADRRLLACKNRFIELYQRCCAAFSVSGRALPEKRRSLTQQLQEAMEELEDMKETLSLSPIAYDVREILESPLVAAAYSHTANAASVVFQNRREKSASFDDILMTGDCTPETIAGISEFLYDSYYVFKAPHHGTTSGYSPLFDDIVFSHVLITNGEYHAGGATAQAYIDMQNSLRHCTNFSACRWYAAAGACCNRLSCCYDQPESGGLAIKCPAAREVRPDQAAGCRILILRHGAARACLCDTAFTGGQNPF